MSWTYTAQPFQAGTPTTQQNRDSVRFLIGDTDTTDQQLADAEIDGLITAGGGSVYEAALIACTTLSAKYARRANKTTGDLSISAADIAQHYRDLKADIRVSAQRHSVPKPYAGGMRESDRDIDAEDDDMIQPSVSVGFMDDTGATPGFTQVVPGG